jgi:two-component system sensor histidine kinase FlrB
LTAIGEMTAEFAHQVRTPLASAMLYAAQIDTADSDQQRVASRISERLCDLGRMVDDMLAFAAGPKPGGEAICVHDLIAGAVKVTEGQLKADTRLEFIVSNRELYVLGNMDSLRGAIINLIKNADQSSERPISIVISGRITDGKVCVSVSDDGDGIPEELQARIFEPFFTSRPEGTGLGLSVVKAVATAHGGDAEVATSGLGTTMTIALPIYAGANDE